MEGAASSKRHNFSSPFKGQAMREMASNLNSVTTGSQMPIQYPEILDVAAPDQLWTWTESDTILYGLCLGFGSDPLDTNN